MIGKAGHHMAGSIQESIPVKKAPSQADSQKYFLPLLPAITLKMPRPWLFIHGGGWQPTGVSFSQIDGPTRRWR